MIQQFLAMIDKKIEERKKILNLSDTFGNARIAWKASVGILQELRSEVEKMGSGWISVKDRLPEDWDSILVAHKDILNIAYRGDNIWYQAWQKIENPDAWQPLPPPPIK